MFDKSPSYAPIIFTLFGVTSVLADTSVFDGLYRPCGSEFGYWDCKSIGRDGGALAIYESVLSGVESNSKLNNPINIRGMSAVLFDRECAGEGEEWKALVMLMAADFGVYVITDNYASE